MWSRDKVDMNVLSDVIFWTDKVKTDSKWFTGILHREMITQQKQTLFLQIFSHAAFIEQKEHDNNDNLCKIHVDLYIASVLSLLSFSFCLIKATRPKICKKSVFSAPEPLKAQVHYCEHALSVVLLSLLTFHIFDFSSETAEQNSKKLDRKQDLNVLYQVCVFWVDRKNKMAALASDWLRHFRPLLWNRWTEFNKTWQEARSQHPLPSLCFSGQSEKQDGRPGLWLEKFSTSLKLLNGIQRNLTGSKISMSSIKFVFFGLVGKRRWPPWPLIGWDIFDLSSQTAERPATKLDRKKDLNVLYQVPVFRADWKNKMAALANPSKKWHIVLRCKICGPLGLLLLTKNGWQYWS